MKVPDLGDGLSLYGWPVGRVDANGRGIRYGQPPGGALEAMLWSSPPFQKYRTIVIVISNIVLVTMHVPEKIQVHAVGHLIGHPMGMAMRFEHLQLFLAGIEKFRDVRCGWNYHPDDNANAQERADKPASQLRARNKPHQQTESLLASYSNLVRTPLTFR